MGIPVVGFVGFVLRQLWTHGANKDSRIMVHFPVHSSIQ